MNNVLKVVFVIIGTMIGAGFASGQEIYLFFFNYGIEGLIGIIIASLILGIVIFYTFQIVKNFKIDTYKDFLNIIINKYPKMQKVAKLKTVINGIINIFILITFFIMIAGFGAYFEQQLGINCLVGSSMLALIVLIVFMTSIKGVVKVNEILVPILIGILTIIGSINLKNINFLELNKYIIKTNSSNFILSAVLYSSYNSILLIPVLLTLKNYIKSKKQIISIASISTVIIMILSIMVFFILAKVDVDITKLEMPAVYVVTNMFHVLSYLYGFTILGSIFTTAISLGTSFLQNVSKNKKSYTQIAIIMCITSVLISRIGFSKLVELLYPIFGYLGLIQIFRLIFYKMYLKNKIE